MKGAQRGREGGRQWRDSQEGGRKRRRVKKKENERRNFEHSVLIQQAAHLPPSYPSPFSSVHGYQRVGLGEHVSVA